MSADPEDTRTTSEKRADAANTRWLAHCHPLFIYEHGERPGHIGWINVRRYTQNGPVDAPRIWPASELQSEDDIFSFFGGGQYELVGRSSLPDGRPGPKVKTRSLKLEGLSKPFTGEVATVAAVSSGAVLSAPTTDPLAAVMAMMAENGREARAAEERRVAREEARTASSQALMIAGLQAVAGIVTTLLSRPAPAPSSPPVDIGAMLQTVASLASSQVQTILSVLPKPEQGDMLDRVTKVLDVADKIRPPKPDSPGESIGDLMQGVGAAMQGFAQVEAMRIEAVKSGANPSAPTLPVQESAGQQNGAPASQATTTIPSPPPDAQGLGES